VTELNGEFRLSKMSSSEMRGLAYQRAAAYGRKYQATPVKVGGGWKLDPPNAPSIIFSRTTTSFLKPTAV
jgi:hypothetical protein